MDSLKSPNKPKKSGISTLLNEKVLKAPNFVSPVLQQVGKLAASVASVGAELALATGSATGNLRNKCALQPGHSLMDWIRLGASGKDLTGLGSRAGYLSVTKQDLAKHNKINDIWLSIRGRVYNVTAYVPFHPGGPDELMKGAGIDATSLFEQVHPWVNYEQILQKCLVGKLVVIDPKIDTEKLFFGAALENDISANVLQTSTKVEDSIVPALSAKLDLEKKSDHTKEPKLEIKDIEDCETEVEDAASSSTGTPRIDWIQKLEYITVIFYTKSFSNPLVEVHPPTHQTEFIVNFIHSHVIYRNKLKLADDVEWPCDIKVTCETGKIELTFKKKNVGIWDTAGTIKQNSGEPSSCDISGRSTFMVKEKTQIAHNIFLMRFARIDGCRIVVPIGKHIRVFINIDGNEWSRSYTPVPSSLFKTLTLNDDTTDEICLMIKSYENGAVSRLITQKEIDDVLYMTKPVGDFDLHRLEKRFSFLILAAGTGITPMLSLLLFLLERRVKKCQFVRLLFFNKTEEDIPFAHQLAEIENLDKRLVINHILSEPAASWTSFSGHVNKELIDNAIQEHIKDTGYTISDIFVFICGPNAFSELSLQELRKLEITQDQIHLFSG